MECLLQELNNGVKYMKRLTESWGHERIQQAGYCAPDSLRGRGVAELFRRRVMT